MGILFLPVLIVIMYFLLIRPQQKRTKDHQQVMMNLDAGDDVVTSSGIYGRISELDGETLFLQVADGIEIKITKDSVAGLVNYEAESDDEFVDE
ncbi:MAG: preprotein translocase subunit YajC [Acidimicrobiales bacterium]